MTITEKSEVGTLDLDELQDFLRDNWDPDLTIREWWDRLGMAGWCAPMLPTNAYGRALTRGDAMRVSATIAAFGAVAAPAGMGVSMVSPTIATHGTQEQIDRFIPDAVTGKLGWCQLFSEPGAGSDLAGLTTRAVKDGDVWHVNGQKVWTSGGQWADMGMLIARTNPDAPKHQGITWFAFDMRQPGVDVRPLKEMTGHTMFNEVFLTDALVHDDCVIGGIHNGWAATNTTLFHERSGMGARGVGGGAGKYIIRAARAGTIANDLDKRAGDFVRLREERPAKAKSASTASDEVGRKRVRSGAAAYIELARAMGKGSDPNTRQRLAQLHILTAIAGYTTERHKAVRASGGDIPGVPNFSKLGTANRLRLQRDLGMELLGARGMLHSYTDEGNAELAKEAPGGTLPMQFTGAALSAQALPIFGGTDQIQRNIIGERVLGLPKEPGDLSNLPFNQLPKNG